ncbi:hypothetical protein F511_29462 [Dorcoceras hygrometricum]|uniref:Methyltransferase type 11 domain-containing protein n=1 Tax=Dorcoceras hygrometricum TaxID=472368 RepID=A0A2Z7ADZ5_9LAMI|nr:hypothetical protein F511_29462 [Dorcoceras hygrometricum]
MERAVGKRSILRNILVRLFLFCVFIVALRFAYVVTVRGDSCDFGDFCFFSLPEDFNIVASGDQVADSDVVLTSRETVPSTSKNIPYLWTTEGFQKAVNFYSTIFQDLVSEGFLSYSSKSLCVETPTGADVFALRENGVDDSIGVFKKPSKPLVVSGEGVRQPFADEVFDFVFCGGGVVEKSMRSGDFAAEIGRTLKPEGFLVVHTAAKDKYSFASFLDLFNCCKLVKTEDIRGHDPNMLFVRQIVMKKAGKNLDTGRSSLPGMQDSGGKAVDNCFVSNYKKELIQKAEPLIDKEPLKPWIALKENLRNIKYLSSMVDISFKRRYVYIDVGARSYGSSIVSWFKKQYPKQNKTFDIYAIEADKSFHDEYKYKKGVTLLPYAAWIRNETLSFEINQDPSHKEAEKGRGMGRILPVQPSSDSRSSHQVDEIQGFDFADWLKNTVSENDYVVMKMDVEGTEFDLIPKLFETGAICLIDEIFLECHYNRWQRCCVGERTTKYQKTYGECLKLFTSLRKSGVLVHQWW